MVSSISSDRLFITVASVGVVSLLVAFNAGNALGGGAHGGGGGGSAHGGVGGAVGGAIGGAIGGLGGALGGGRGGSPGDAGNGDSADRGGIGVSARTEQGLAVGNQGAKRSVIGEDGERCRNTLLNFLRGRTCSDGFPEPDQVDEDMLDQAAYSPVEEPLAREPESTNEAEQAQSPTKQKATAPVSAARLNIEKPSAGKPDAVAKAQAKPGPRLSCDKAGAIVADYAFSAIKPSNCNGQIYAFNASRDGKSFAITLDAVSGELIEVRKVP